MSVNGLAIDYSLLAAAIMQLSSNPGNIVVPPNNPGGSAPAADKAVVSKEVPKEVPVTEGEWQKVAKEAVEETGSESGSSRCSGGVPAEVSDEVKRAVSFTGGDEVEGFYRGVVRRENTRRVAAWVWRLTGQKVPKYAMQDLALATFTTGTVPAVVHGGRERIDMLAGVGDACMAYELALAVAAERQSMSVYQVTRGANASNANLRRVMFANDLVQWISFPSDVDPKTTKLTATAFEAILGALALNGRQDMVRTILRACGIIPKSF